MKIALRARAQCIAARSRGLYNAEEFIPCCCDLDLNTTSAGKLVTLQWVNETLDKLDKYLDQRRPAQHPPPPAPEGLDRRQPAQDQPPQEPPLTAREKISSQWGMPLHVHSGSKKKAPRSYAGRELRSFVADRIIKYAKAGADSKTMFDDIFGGAMGTIAAAAASKQASGAEGEAAAVAALSGSSGAAADIDKETCRSCGGPGGGASAKAPAATAPPPPGPPQQEAMLA